MMYATSIVKACSVCQKANPTNKPPASTLLQSQRKTAQENIAAAQRKQKNRYDLKHAPPTYKVGDKYSSSLQSEARDTRKGDKQTAIYRAIRHLRRTGPRRVAYLSRSVFRCQVLALKRDILDWQ